MILADKGESNSIEICVIQFQDTCKELKYSKYPVGSAASGLTVGGGFEVLVQSNFVASHTNIVVGLVETRVGLVPAGGGCKEMLWRGSQTSESKNDPDYAPLTVVDIIGYGKTATSPVEAEPLKYLLPENKKIMSRNSLLNVARYIIDDNRDFKPPAEVSLNLPGKPLKEKMIKL